MPVNYDDEEQSLREREASPLGRLALRFVKLGGIAVVLVAVLGVALWFGGAKAPDRAPRAVAEAETDLSVVAQRTGRRGLYNGFDVSNATIPADDILPGGPPRDGIPAIFDPKFTSVGQTRFLRDDDLVVGYSENGETKAYPIRILVWHEIVNDTVGGRPIAITYCPLCGTCMVFDRKYGGQTLTFGVSGLLYKSDVLMYDRQSESLWSQLKMESISGSMVGTKLGWLPSEQMTWGAWKALHPDGLVLTTETGTRRDYSRDPYAGYEDTERTYFPVGFERKELGKKTWVIGVVVNGEAKAYPVEELERLGGEALRDSVAGTELTVEYDAGRQWAKVIDTDSGEERPLVRVFWFAWQAFYPQTALYTGP